MNWNFLLIVLVVLGLIGVFLWLGFKNSSKSSQKITPLVDFNVSFQANNQAPIVINYNSNVPIVTTVTTNNGNSTTTTNPPAPNPSAPGTVTVSNLKSTTGAILYGGILGSSAPRPPRPAVSTSGRVRSLLTPEEKSINDGNVITGILVYDVPSFQELTVTDYAVTNVIFQNNLPGLEILNLSNNGVENLDLSKVPNVLNFNGSSNFFTSLDLSSNNKIQILNLSDNDSLSTINLTNASELKNLILQNVNTTSTGKVNITGINSLVSLQNITASSLEPIQLDDLPVKDVIKFLTLNDSGYTNSDINLSQYTGLISLSLESNNFTGTMDLTGLNLLQSVSLRNNSLTGLILPVSNDINFLSIAENSVSSLDISSCVSTLKSLYCGTYGIDVTGLDQTTILDTLEISFNTPVSLNDFSNLSTLTVLDCSNSNFSSNTLNVSNLTNLNVLNFDNILNVNVIGLSSLADLLELQFSDTNYNPDLTVIPSLRTVIGNNNNLTSIDLTNLSNLEGLTFVNNNISSVYGLSSCVNIKVFSLPENSLNSSSVDDILITINSFNTSGISIDLLNNSPRTSASDSAFEGLISRGWIVVLDP